MLQCLSIGCASIEADTEHTRSDRMGRHRDDAGIQIRWNRQGLLRVRLGNGLFRLILGLVLWGQP